jgi:hypothetical protein
MKTYQSVLIAGLMGIGLAACSSTDMNAGSPPNVRTGTQDVANATAHVNGSNGGGADNSAGNSAGTGNSGVSANNQ